MAITLPHLEELLDQCNVSTGPAVDNMVPLVIEGGGEQTIVTLQLDEDGDSLQFRTMYLLRVLEKRHWPLLLITLAKLNGQYKMIKFALDTSDGEVIAYCDLFLADASLTAAQLQRCILLLKTVVLPSKKRLEKLLATGEDPGESPIDSLGLLLEGFAASGKERTGPSETSESGPKPAHHAGLDDAFLGTIEGILEQHKKKS